ncbi:MAG: vWA domain-containing protein [Planctomycetota bacterium]
MVRRTPLRGWVYVLGLALAAWLAAPAQAHAADIQPDPAPLDVLFLVDNSHSLKRYDPFHLRTDLIKSLVEFYAGAGDRFALATFGQSQVDFEAYKPEDWDKLVNSTLGDTDAYTSDPEDALSMPLKAAANRADPNPLWVIMVTDGDINVYNQEHTPQAYIDAAFRAYGRAAVLANPDLINTQAANTMGQPDFVKQFTALKAIYTSVIFQDHADAFYTALAATAAQNAKPVLFNSLTLNSLFLGVLHARPYATQPSMFAYGSMKLEGGMAQTVPIDLPQGHQHARLVFFGVGEKFSLRLLQGGEEKAAAGQNDADQHAVLNLETLPAGHYDLEIKNTGRGRELVAEYALFLKIDAHAEIAPAQRTAIDSLPFTAALRNSDKKTLTDPAVLKDLKATLTLTPAGAPAGAEPVATQAFDLSQSKQTLGNLVLPVKISLPPGDYTAAVEFQSLPLKTGGFGLDLAATAVVKLAPVLEVNFTDDPKAKHFVNETANLTAQFKSLPAGGATDETQTVTLVNDQGGDPAKVVLTKNSQGAYLGAFPAERAGRWTIKAEFTDSLAVGPGDNASFMATPFDLTAHSGLVKQVYVRQPYQPIFTSDDFQKFSNKDPEPTLALTLAVTVPTPAPAPAPATGAATGAPANTPANTPAGAPAPATPAASHSVTLQLALDKDLYAKDQRVSYSVTAGSRFLDPGSYHCDPGFVGATYLLTTPIAIQVLPRTFTLEVKQPDGSWQTVGAAEPAKVTLQLPWDEAWPSAPADQASWIQNKFNNQLHLRATVSLGQHAANQPEKAVLTLTPIENKYSPLAEEAGADKDDIYAFQSLDNKNEMSGASSADNLTPQSAEMTFSLQPSRAIKFDGPLCIYAAKVKIDGYELPDQPQFDVTVECPDKAWRQFMELLPFILIGIVVVALIIWWVTIPRFKEHQIRPLRKGQPLNTVHMLVGMKVGMTGREAVATPEAPNCLKFRRVNSSTTAVTSINEKVFVFVGSDKITGWRNLKHGDEMVVDGAGVFQRYRYFERQPTEEELKAASASALDEDSDIIVEGL